MPLFHRPCKTRCANAYPTCGNQEDLHNTVQSLTTVLQQHGIHTQAQSGSTNMRPSSAVLCATALAALAGTALYAIRNPRTPPDIHPVENFDLSRYVGKWYEVARIEHRFERGLQRSQAEYGLLQDGSIQITNRGYDPKREEWKISHGKATPTLAPDIAALKVSFFRPFYDGYNVVALDKDYEWAMVIGSKLDYFWILSRQPSLPEGIGDRLLHQATLLGVDTQKILWVHQDGVNPTGSYK